MEIWTEPENRRSRSKIRTDWVTSKKRQSPKKCVNLSKNSFKRNSTSEKWNWSHLENCLDRKSKVLCCNPFILLVRSQFFCVENDDGWWCTILVRSCHRGKFRWQDFMWNSVKVLCLKLRSYGAATQEEAKERRIHFSSNLTQIRKQCRHIVYCCKEMYMTSQVI